MKRLFDTLRLPGRAWAALALLHSVAALLAWAGPSAALDWQPGLAWQEPWRAWTAAWVHWSPLHLSTNLLAAAVVAVFGWAAQVPTAAALAWALSWPLTHWGWLLRPELAHYGGLSGILHGGVAIVCAWLLLCTRGWRRTIGAAVALGLAVKLIQEQPLGPALRHGGGWDIAVAPLAHTLGALAGLLCAALVTVTLVLIRTVIVPRMAARSSAQRVQAQPPGGRGGRR